jgi:ABC-type polysaccharide/polyol phosphate export permease
MDWFHVTNGVLTAYSWGAAAILSLTLFLVSRFYEEKAGQRSYFQLFLIPPLLFLVGGVRYALIAGDLVGDIPGDVAFFLGGLSLSILSYFLFNLMTGGRR